MAQLIGFDQIAAEIAQGVSDKRFAAGEAAGESYAEHKCFSAACTVFDMSMAMVSGPTPPGTGV